MEEAAGDPVTNTTYYCQEAEGVYENFLNRKDMGFSWPGMEYNMLYLELAYQLGVTNIADDDDFSIHANQLSINFGVNF